MCRRLAASASAASLPVASALVLAAGAIASPAAGALDHRQASTAGPPGPPPVMVAATQSNARAMHGPARFGATLVAPSRRGDLLIAAVVCGVVGNGTAVPTLRLPAGWHRAVRRVGGFEGGLESALYFYPSNPGGLRRFSVGSVPRGTDAYCTTFTAELRVATGGVRLVATGSGQSWGTSVTATTTGIPMQGALVLLASTDGTEEVRTTYTVPPGFRKIQEQTDGRRFQPGTLSSRFGWSAGEQGGRVGWTGATTDGCAVVAVLHV